MSKYLAIMSKKLMSNLTYRLATVLNMLAMSTYFLASYYFWQALIAGGARPDANIRDLMFYSLLSEIVIQLCYSDVAGLLEGEIQDGSVAMHFIRPISFRLECFSLSFGENLYWTSVLVLPAIVTCALLVGLPERLGEMLNLRVTVGENPQDDVAVGCCAAAADDRIAQRFLQSGCLIEL